MHRGEGRHEFHMLFRDNIPNLESRTCPPIILAVELPHRNFCARPIHLPLPTFTLLRQYVYVTSQAFPCRKSPTFPNFGGISSGPALRSADRQLNETDNLEGRVSYFFEEAFRNPFPCQAPGFSLPSHSSVGAWRSG